MYQPTREEIKEILNHQRRAYKELLHYSSLCVNFDTVPIESQETITVLRDFASSEESFYREQMEDIAEVAFSPFEKNLSLYFLGDALS